MEGELDVARFDNVNKGRNLDDPTFLKMLEDQKAKEEGAAKRIEEARSAQAKKTAMFLGGVFLAGILVGVVVSYGLRDRGSATIRDGE